LKVTITSSLAGATPPLPGLAPPLELPAGAPAEDVPPELAEAPPDARPPVALGVPPELPPPELVPPVSVLAPALGAVPPFDELPPAVSEPPDGAPPLPSAPPVAVPIPLVELEPPALLSVSESLLLQAASARANVSPAAESAFIER
jgi:hypothetical protein